MSSPHAPSLSGLAQHVVLLTVALGLSACGTVGPEASMRSKDRVTTFGANPQFDNERYEMVDLVTLLDPEGRRFKAPYSKEQPTELFFASAFDSTNSVDDAKADAQANTQADITSRRALALAEHAFYSYDGSTFADRRNRVQDRLIGASNQRCSAYKVYLNRFDAYQQTGFGWATTILGGAAAIVGGLKDARILGGLAGVSSGMQAEISQGFLGNLASYVIVPGIELRRRAIHEEMMARRASETEYTLQAALADAARYHGACTLSVGLEQAKEAIQTVENPGMRMVAVTLNNVMQARAMQQTIAKAEAGKATPDDYVIRSFRVEGVPIAAATGQAGVRAKAGFGIVPKIAPDEHIDQVTGTAKAALEAVRAQRDVLDALISGLQQEIDTPSKPALTGKLTALVKELAGSKTAFKETLDALQKSATANSTATSAALACTKKLQDRLNLADPSQRNTALADLAVATVMVETGYKPWLEDRGKALEIWRQPVKAALAANQFDALQGLDAATIDPTKLAKAVKDAVTPGAKLLDSLPALDFAARKLDCAATGG